MTWLRDLLVLAALVPVLVYAAWFEDRRWRGE